MRSTYWSCTKFADWLRGTAKPHAETSKGWRIWNENAKTAHKFRYWLAEEGLDAIQNTIMFIPDKIHAVKYYINNRFITRTHCLTSNPRDIPRGEWRDVGNRFLPCLFNELVEFVEVELAWWHLAWSPEERSKYNMPWWAVGWWRVRTWRCKQAGLDNLEWQMNIRADESYGLKEGDEGWNEPTRQAINAKEILDLYKWWTEVYPNRPDPYEVSGWSDICEMRRKRGDDFFELEDKTPEETEASKIALDKINELELSYKQEDEEMMIRLIKIRDSLWT
jgi:hypothetical protein